MHSKDLSWLSRSELLIGPEGIQKLQSAHILIVGLGVWDPSRLNLLPELELAP